MLSCCTPIFHVIVCTTTTTTTTTSSSSNFIFLNNFSIQESISAAVLVRARYSSIFNFCVVLGFSSWVAFDSLIASVGVLSFVFFVVVLNFCVLCYGLEFFFVINFSSRTFFLFRFMQGFQASKFMGECKVRQNTTLLHYPYAALMMTHKGFLRCSFLNLLFFLSTVTPRNTGCQGTNKFHPLLADFHYCQYRKSKEITSRDQGLAFLIGGFPLLLDLGPVKRGIPFLYASSSSWWNH